MEYPPAKKQKLTGTSSGVPNASTSSPKSGVEHENFADYLSPQSHSNLRAGHHSKHLRTHFTHASLHRKRTTGKYAPLGQDENRLVSRGRRSDSNGEIRTELDSRDPQSSSNEPPVAVPPPSSDGNTEDVPLIPLIFSAANLEASESPGLFTGLPAASRSAISVLPYHPLTAITNIPISYVVNPTPAPPTTTPTTLSSSTISSGVSTNSTTTPATTASSTFSTSSTSRISTTSSPSSTSTSSLSISTPVSESSIPASTPAASTNAPGAAGAAGAANGGSDEDNNGGRSSPTPAIVGGVVGGVAGLVILLLLALLLLRYLKRKKHGPPRGIREGEAEPAPRQPPMEEAPIAAGGFGIMKRLSRPKSESTAPPAERGFERLSGRKLPSQFSPGMEGPTREPGFSGAAYPSGSSAYPSGGTFLTDATDAPLNLPQGSTPTPPPPDSPGVATRAALAALSSGGQHNDSAAASNSALMPGPARTPQLQQGEQGRSSHLAPVGRATPTYSPSHVGHTPPLSPLRPTLGRNHSSLDGSRSSRFLEDVG